MQICVVVEIMPKTPFLKLIKIHSMILPWHIDYARCRNGSYNFIGTLSMNEEVDLLKSILPGRQT